MTKRDGDREHARPLPWRHAIQIAHELREEVVGEQFPDDGLQEGTGPSKLRAACGELPQRTRTKLLPPPVGIEPLFCSSGFFELTVDVVEQVTELAHGCTSTNAGAHVVRRVVRVGLGRPAS
jgi:hypothetical protein